MDNQLREYIERFRTALELPGLAASVVRDGEVILAEGFGVRSIQSGEPVSGRSLFHMASVSKPFSATALMQLVEQGKMDLDLPLVHYLPYFSIDDERFKTITIRQMLSHISGMPDVHDYEWGNPNSGEDALENYVRSLTGAKMIFDPGCQFAYSNIAFELLGAVIARVSGLSFEEYIKQSIFTPLGMTDSTFLRADVPVELSVSPHRRLIGNEIASVYPYNRAHAPSSTLHMNAVDACRWMQANLNRGILEGSRILQEKSYEELWKPVTQRNENLNVGLSWFTGQRQGFTTIEHGGSDEGFRSHLSIIPEKNMGVTVMCNLNPAAMDELTYVLLDILLGFTPAEPLTPVLYPVLVAYNEGGFQAACEKLESLRRTKAALNFGMDAFLNVAYQLNALGQPTQALDVLNLGLLLEPESAILHAILARVYSNLQEMEKSKVSLDKALAIDPENGIVKMLLMQLSSSK